MRAGLARRAGIATIRRRKVAPRTRPWLPVRIRAARSTLWAMAAQMTQALLAPNFPDGRWASGPLMRFGGHGFNDRVFTVGDVGGIDRFVVVGEKRVIPPHREHCVGIVGVFDAAHDQPGGDRMFARFDSGVGGFGDFGIRYPCAGVRVLHGSGVVHGGPRVVVDGFDGGYDFGVLGHHDRELNPGPNAGSYHCARPVGTIPANDDGAGGADGPGGGDGLGHHPPAPLPGPVLPARNWIPATAGAAWSVLSVVANGESLAQDLFSGDFGVLVGGALFGAWP